MLTTAQAIAFLLTAVTLTATPGPDNLMVLSVGMSKGRRAGIVFGLGCALGCLSHTVLAVIGVGAILAASPVAFTALKWAGGAYLIWLGTQALRHAGAVRIEGAHSNSSSQLAAESLGRTFSKGLIANAINPKVVLFFLSFLPQFVDAAHGSMEMQLGLLGLLFTAQAAVLFGLLGYFSGRVGGWIHRKPRVGVWLDRLAGTVFIALGLRMVAR